MTHRVLPTRLPPTHALPQLDATLNTTSAQSRLRRWHTCTAAQKNLATPSSVRMCSPKPLRFDVACSGQTRTSIRGLALSLLFWHRAHVPRTYPNPRRDPADRQYDKRKAQPCATWKRPRAKAGSLSTLKFGLYAQTVHSVQQHRPHPVLLHGVVLCSPPPPCRDRPYGRISRGSCAPGPLAALGGRFMFRFMAHRGKIVFKIAASPVLGRSYRNRMSCRTQHSSEATSVAASYRPRRSL